jgi:DNA phosphorothioation-dependent restriction protein DptH
MASAFIAAGLDATGTIPYVDNDRFPDFSHVGHHLEQQNERAFNRLEPLFSLGLFKPEFKPNSFHELTGRSMVIDLSMIPSEEIKNALAQLVVMSAHAYFNSILHSGTIRQLFVIDEAFRVLEYESMADFVLQCRAYGVGMLLSSQYPSQFPIDVSSSLATKVIHGNGRDSNRIRDIVQLIRCEGREGDIAGLERFQAFIDNRHQPHTLIRTMNYPLYLVWSRLQELGSATREELTSVAGFNPTMLPINNLVQLLTRMGLAEEKDGKINVISRVG